MKTFIISLVVLAILITGVCVYSVYLDKTMSDLQENLECLLDCINKEQWDKCENEINCLSKNWEKNEPILAMFNDHEDIDNINLSVSDLKESIACKDTEHTLKSLKETKILLERIRKNETLSLENILGLAPVGLSCHIML